MSMTNSNEILTNKTTKNRTGVFSCRNLQASNSTEEKVQNAFSAREKLLKINRKYFHRSTKDQTAMKPSETAVSLARATFPPWINRNQRVLASATTQRATSVRQTPSRCSFYSSPASAKLKAEIDFIQNKYQSHLDLYKRLVTGEKQVRLKRRTLFDEQNQRKPFQEISVISGNVNPLTNSIRLSSASTNITAAKYPMNSIAPETVVSNSIVIPSPLPGDDEIPLNEQEETTHTFRVPRPSVIGEETFFLSGQNSSNEKKIARSNSTNHRNEVSCPFYMIYFAKLNRNQGDRARRTTQTNTSFRENKRFAATIDAFERENSSLLKDLLRTTARNHLKI